MSGIGEIQLSSSQLGGAASQSRPLLGAWLMLGVALLLSGCASGPVMTPQLESELISRAEERWSFLMSRDFGEAWEYTSPAFREVFTKSMYKNRFSYMVDWELTSIELLNYDAEAAVASLAVRVMSEPVKATSAASAALGAVPTESVEKWVFVDGQWWYSPTVK